VIRVVRLDYPNPDGTTTRQHLIAYCQATGEHDAELDPPAGYVAYLVGLFWDAQAGRAAFYSPQALTWSEIKAWVDLTGRTLCPFEIDVIRAADSAFRAECATIEAERSERKPTQGHQSG
jgi:hypothetical protein